LEHLSIDVRDPCVQGIVAVSL